MLFYAITLHLVADVLLQSRWQSENKANLKHPASWVHSSIHFAAMLFVFPPILALCVALAHLWIDTDIPLNWWRRVFLKAEASPLLMIAQDQAAHLALLSLAVFLAS